MRAITSDNQLMRARTSDNELLNAAQRSFILNCVSLRIVAIPARFTTTYLALVRITSL